MKLVPATIRSSRNYDWCCFTAGFECVKEITWPERRMAVLRFETRRRATEWYHADLTSWAKGDSATEYFDSGTAIDRRQLQSLHRRDARCRLLERWHSNADSRRSM